MSLRSEQVHARLLERGVSFYAGVPDSLLAPFCAWVADHSDPARHVITANEGSAVALAAGHHLASGELGLVYLQNSGLGNAVNPLTSLADAEVYGIPMLLMIGWRGEPGTEDEPQHRKMGRVTGPLLDAIGVPYSVLPGEAEAAAASIDAAVEASRARGGPHALLVPAGRFEPYAKRPGPDEVYEMGREQALSILLEAVGADAAVVSTTGMASRELFELREARGERHERDFLTVGSMGHCSQIALGIALAQPGRELWCIDGDGAAIMHLGGLATIGAIAPPGLRHVVLNNAAHDSVGGQPTVAQRIDLCAIARACGYREVHRAEDENALRAALEDLGEGPILLEVRVRRGARADLGRPTLSTQRAREQFSEFLRK